MVGEEGEKEVGEEVEKAMQTMEMKSEKENLRIIENSKDLKKEIDDEEIPSSEDESAIGDDSNMILQANDDSGGEYDESKDASTREARLLLEAIKV